MSVKFKKILVANRGEIARRVYKTAREMGISTVGIYTDEEKELPHSFEADFSVGLGSGPLSETYLNIDRLVQICLEHKIDAVHPGYGFLSENSKFAEALAAKGIKLIGPPTSAMEAMGDKKTSKIMMEKINAPLIPGYHGDNQEPDFLFDEAKKIGFPVLVKASAGGGGKGMRIVESEGEFTEALEGAKREALNAFGNDQVLIEKFITNPRHIEVQVMSDTHGNHFHLFERECSIQRRYQKIVEETPSVALDEKLRQDITQTAAKIAEHMKYEGAGTVEFILDQDGKYYFLEMNTRLQVEHPITEMVTGKDLVRLQIEVAQGEKLDFTQEDLTQNGHAIEVRLYAEDPDNNFLPSIGKIIHVGKTSLRDVRLDTGYIDGNNVTISFDPMLAKLIVHAENRGQAIEKLKLALLDFPFLGLKTNREYLLRILNHQGFVEGDTYTHFVQTHENELGPKEVNDDDLAKAIALYLSQDLISASSRQSNDSFVGPWESLAGFRMV